ncbi:aminotransferase class V-fold PLP-dependent enzyme [Synergistaceae bacterium OttesenSCG-928-I11]|nr:aminotransferase class V-fold PLP-dependent enzyme [Synergistaceae bacterium OttesenSCG-928-I11]
MHIYLNNAATTYPKPPAVARAMADFVERGGANLSRGSASDRDLNSMNVVLNCREALCEFFGCEDSEFVTFTSNVTHSLNMVLKGYLRPGMRVLTTSMEHNSVTRPLRSLEAGGVEVVFIPCDDEGYLRTDDLARELAKKHTDLVVLSYASNVCGAVQDVPAISRLCASDGVPLVLDAAQAAGHMAIDVRELGCDALCFTGHKGLFGPQGTGGVIWKPSFAHICVPLMEGGTGSFSHEDVQPDAMPDKFEAGTPNMPGIAGLHAALEFICAEGLENIVRREHELGAMLLNGLREIEDITIYGPRSDRPRVPVIAMNFHDIDNARAAHILSTRYGIETRPGIHCSPIAHRTLGSFPQGALRLSPGYFNTDEEIEYVIRTIRTLADM